MKVVVGNRRPHMPVLVSWEITNGKNIWAYKTAVVEAESPPWASRWPEL